MIGELLRKGIIGLFVLAFVSNAIPYMSVPYLVVVAPLFAMMQSTELTMSIIMLALGASLGKLVVYGVSRGVGGIKRVRVDPIIPSVNDDPYLIAELIEVVKEAGARHIVTATYKAKWDSLSRLSQAIPEIAGKLRELYVYSGVKIHGYMYLTRNKREELLLPVVKTAIKLGLTVATCREGLNSQYFQAPSCDGSHLISLSPRSKININRS